MSLRVWLPLNGDYRNQGLSDLSFASSGTSLVSNDGKMGKCVSSTGSGYLISNNPVYLGQNQSVFCWIKPAVFNSSASLTGVCGQHRYHRCTGMGITLKRATDTTGYVCYTAGDGSNRSYSHYPGNTLLTANNWYHVGYTYDGTTVRLYVNGTLDGSYEQRNLATPEDYFQCFMWSLGIEGGTVYSGYGLSGKLNDVRAYDHTLSTKEIKELAKGKMVHYTFNEGSYEEVTNLFIAPKVGPAYTTSSWDASLHHDAISVSGWTVGCNPGVTSPTVGYHASWINMNGMAVMKFPKLNHTVSGVDTGRWLGISSTNALSGTLKTGTTYTVSFEAMADVEGRIIYGGYYYDRSGANNFHDGSFYARDIPVGKWKKYAFTFTAGTVTAGGVFYFYGMQGTNGIAYLRNPQVEVGSVAHDYVEGTKVKDTIIYDSAGMNYNGIVSGMLISAEEFANDPANNTANTTDKNYYSAKFNGSTYITYDNHMAIPDAYTMTFWLKKVGGGHIIDWRSSVAQGEPGVQPAYINPGTNLLQYYSSAGGSVYFNYVFSDNTWYHIALAVSATQVILYVNGEKQQTISATNPTGIESDLHIGCRVSYINIPTMNMKDFRLYATTLKAEDIKQIYNTPLIIDNKHNIFATTLKEGSL